MACFMCVSVHASVSISSLLLDCTNHLKEWTFVDITNRDLRTIVYYVHFWSKMIEGHNRTNDVMFDVQTACGRQN